MTPNERDLTTLGFANLTQSGDKLAGLHWLQNDAIGMYCGLRIEAGRAAWDHDRQFRCLDDAHAALVLWRLTQENGQAARP